MGSDILQRLLIKVDSNLPQAERDARAMTRASKELGAAFKQMDAQQHQVTKSLEKYMKALEQPTLFQSFKGSMKSIGEVMGPFNQGLELAGKALRFAEAGLDAYAKTSATAAGEVRALTNEFTYYKNVVMAGVGEVTVELGKSAVNFDQAVEALRRGGEKGFGKAYGQITQEWNALNTAIKDTGLALAGFAENEMERFGQITGRVASNATKAMENAVAEARKFREEMDKIGKKLLGSETPADRAIRQGAADRAAFEADVQRGADQLERQEAFDRRSVLGDNTLANQVGAFDLKLPSQEEWDSLRQNLNQVASSIGGEDRRKSLLEAAFGPIEEFDAYMEAMESLGAVTSSFSLGLQTTLKAIGEGGMSAGDAFKKGLGVMVSGIGDYLAAQSGRHAVEAIAHAVVLDFPGAARHAAAAGVYGIGAVGAYAVASKLGAGGGASNKSLGAGGGSAASSSGGSARPSSSSSSGGGEDKSQPLVFIVGNHFDDMSGRQRRIRAREEVERAIRERDE